MTAISFLRPELLWLLLLVPVILFWPQRVHDRGHAVIRAVVLILVLLAMAAPVRLTSDEAHHHVFVVDLTTSAAPGARTAGADALQEMLEGLDAAAKVSFVGLAAEGALGDRLAERFTSVEHLPADESNLGDALLIAALRIPEGSRGAVTLISDGSATDRGWNRALQTLTARGIPLHTVTLEQPKTDVRPVRFVAGGTLRVGQTARLLVDVVGPRADVRVQLTGPDGVVAESGEVRVENRRRIALEFEPKNAGYVSYTARVEVVRGPDSRTENNSIANMFAVQDPIRALYLGGRVEGGAARLGELLGSGFELDETSGVEGGAEDLDAYDLVVLDDCKAADVPRDFQRQLVSAVSDKGLGLAMTGGSGSFGPGGYHKTPIESVLPVELVQKEEKKDPSTSLAVIIDTSGSMGGNRVILAKEVTRLALRRLLPHDKFGIVEFYGTKRWAAPLQSAANAIDIQRALNRLDAGGGTILFPAIEEAYFGLRNVQTRYKHVLILTDAGVESGPYEQLLRRMARDGICVSTVLVGPGRHSEFLVELADWGRGRFYNASDRFNLPEIMLKQPSSARLPGYRAGVQMVEALGGRGWWGDTDPNAVPAVSGYVETRKRPGADVLVRTRQDHHPVLASWRFGLGRVTAMTTEPTGPGTEGFKGWDGYGPFLARVLSRTAAEGRLPFRFELTRRETEIVLTAKRLDRGASLPAARIAANAPESDRVELAFRERAKGLYEARVDWAPADPAQVIAGVRGRTRGSFRLVSAPREDVAAELQVDPAWALDLGAAATATGGQSLVPAAVTGFVPSTGGGERALALHKLWPLCLLLALIFYLGDLIWRRSPWPVRTST